MQTHPSLLEIEELLQEASQALDAYEDEDDLEPLQQALEAWTQLWMRHLLGAVTAEFRLCLLNDGAYAHLLRYQALGDTKDLRLALEGWERVVAETPPGSVERPGRLTNLGNGLIQLYHSTAELAYLERAIALQREALFSDASHSPSRARFLSKLASALLLRHARVGCSVDLDEAVDLLREALESIPEDSADHSGLLCNLGGALLRRFEQDGAPNDFDEAVTMCEKAFNDTSRARDAAAIAHNLGKALQQRYQQTGCGVDLDRAVLHLQQAVDMTDARSTDSALYLNNLASALSDLYESTGDLEYLDAALATYRGLLGMPSASPVDEPTQQSNRASALIALYAHEGDKDVLVEAVDICRRALHAAPLRAPGRASLQHNLAAALIERYRLTSQLYDLEEAISLLEEAVEAPSSNNPGRHAHLNNLGNALLSLYERNRNEQVLDRSIASYEKALQHVPLRAPVRIGYLGNLANGLSHRYSLRQSKQDLDRRLSLCTQAAQATTSDSPYLAGYLSGIGAAYLDLFQTVRNPAYLEHATAYLGQAVESAATSPSLSGYLYNLGLVATQQHLYNHDEAHRCRAREAFREACRKGISFLPAVALDAAKAWSELALDDGAWHETAEACAFGLEAAESVYRAQLHRGHKHTWLHAARGIAANGAYALARCGRLREAVLMLESDRARLLSEALERDRADLSQLQETAPQLHRRYLACMEHLRWLEAKDLAREASLATGQLLRDALSTAYGELLTIAEEIRYLPAQEGFMAPLSWADLIPAYECAPLVYIAYSAVGGVAFVVWGADDISVLWLPELTRQSLETEIFGESGAEGYAAAYRAFRDEPSRAGQDAWRNAVASCIDWLARVVMTPVIAALVERNAAHAALIPTGLLALLPLQAVDSDIPFAFAPNAKVLAINLGMAEQSSFERAMIVSDPNPGGNLGLPFSGLEVIELKEGLASAEHLHMEGDGVSRRLVLEALSSYEVWHFATHGQADWQDALDSFVLLAQEERLTLRDLLSLRTEGALAVLSACETGIPEVGLPDESISLASGMLQAGARCVVSSFWPVHDLSTALLMNGFYRELATGGESGPIPVVVALHKSQEWLKQLSLNEARTVLVEWMANPSISPDVHNQLLRQFTSLERRGQHPFAEPYYWAGFQAHGAAF